MTDHAHSRRLGATMTMLLPMLHALACNPLVKVDVDCTKLCLKTDGETIPRVGRLPSLDGGRLPFDGGPGASPIVWVEWVSVLKTDEVLQQLPTASSKISGSAFLVQADLTGTDDLSSVESATLSLASSTLPRDGGTAPRFATEPDAACAAERGDILLAVLPTGAVGTAANVIDMQPVDPNLNLFACLKDRPARFAVRLAVDPQRFPDRDVAVQLRVCFRIAIGVGYP